MAGFVLVRFVRSETKVYYSIAVFFVMKKYRKHGVGKRVSEMVFDLHKGNWVVHQIERNTPAQLFWRKVISEYTQGKFTDRFESGKRIQEFTT